MKTAIAKKRKIQSNTAGRKRCTRDNDDPRVNALERGATRGIIESFKARNDNAAEDDAY